MSNINDLILVLYVDVKGCNSQEADDRVQTSKAKISSIRKELGNVKIFIISSHENRIECINPRIVGQEEYNRALKIIDELENKLK